jgi:hypothetical protein
MQIILEFLKKRANYVILKEITSAPPGKEYIDKVFSFIDR